METNTQRRIEKLESEIARLETALDQCNQDAIEALSFDTVDRELIETECEEIEFRLRYWREVLDGLYDTR